MTKIKMEVEVEYDDEIMHSDDSEAKKWFLDDVLGGELILHSNEIGDEVGRVKVLKFCIE